MGTLANIANTRSRARSKPDVPLCARVGVFASEDLVVFSPCVLLLLLLQRFILLAGVYVLVFCLFLFCCVCFFFGLWEATEVQQNGASRQTPDHRAVKRGSTLQKRT